MSHNITHTTTRIARVHHSGRDGITVAHLREFLADCDAVGIPDGTRVRLEDKLAGEGANRRGYLEALHRNDLDDWPRCRWCETTWDDCRSFDPGDHEAQCCPSCEHRGTAPKVAT